MKISDAERLTGLTAKAIRLYEEKGLICIARKDNLYRDYTQEDIDRLNFIRSLREIGVSLSQICLCFNGVITFEEMLDHRKNEMEKENTFHYENYLKCVSALDSFKEKNVNIIGKTYTVNDKNVLMGLDIGTTNMSMVIIDCDRQEILETYTVANQSKIESEDDFSEFDAEWIAGRVIRIMDYLTEVYPNIQSIGVTGQMHGFLYVSADGKAVSPLYNWQDGRGNRLYSKGKTYCREIFDRTGHICYAGYAFATLFYNRFNHLEPEGAKSFCSIMDYIVMVLTGRKTPLIHMSNAASFGLCDIEKCRFDYTAVEKLDLAHLDLPEITNKSDVAGYYRNIPVSVAIGDNQASFFGSVKDDKTSVLINIGTGSQVSAVSDTFTGTAPELEIRPYLFGKYLISGSALCGGKSYAILERFFSDYVHELLGNKSSQYEVMNRLAQKVDIDHSPLDVSTLFCGTRVSPEKRGGVSGIDDKNFTPENLILGVLYGMVNELKTYYDRMELGDITHVVAAGNGVKLNPVLQKILEKIFRMRVTLTSYNEEAAIGSALFAGISAGKTDIEQIKSIIREKEKDE